MHLLSAIISAFSSSITSIFGKLSFEIGATPLQILFIRFLFSFLLSLILFSLYKKNFNLKHFSVFGSLGILNYGIAALLFFYGLRFLNPAYATVVFFTNPIFVLIFQKLIYKHKIDFISVISIFLSFTGVTLANFGEKGIENNNLFLGTTIVLTSALLNALFVTVSSQRIKKINSDIIENIFYTFLGTILFYTIILVFSGQYISLKVEYLNYGLLLAIFSTFIPLTLNYFSLKKLSSHSLAIIMPLELVFASLLSILIFHEKFNYVKIFGFILVGLAPIVENITIYKKKYKNT
ncbi:UAA transporter family protein [Thermosipho affectus]|uniref:UAA transporter family protein n=1 Tax=Thermosipho affectus TaxID=660294 RepID=A0ABX3ILR3_9BACT|nr:MULTISPECIES: DMT family transporter [Thermosipho]ANQ52943.1 UAA transporter family protein [Thermosipho sp. 1070]APT71389.1 UAA transporter family protein [Thermosipho sp. 1063]ONN28091.1 UAA transporter family protein [Thermosipho affectus]OOC46041.1 UAA transporter family protein [Thermosipho sp. 1074]